MTARPVAVRTGEKLSSAHTVQGSEKEKPTTPSSAMASPWRSRVDVTAAPYFGRYRDGVAAIWDLNADLGEGDPEMDARLLPVITSANVACGAHAGDDTSMSLICATAAELGVTVGAQVSYVDREGFGRRRLDVPARILREQLAAQISVLDGHARAAGTSVVYVKPHGALYHAAAVDPVIADVVMDAAQGLPVLTLPHGALVEAARHRGVDVHAEAFADRGYAADGALVPRSHPRALLASNDEVIARVHRLVSRGEIVAEDGSVVRVDARSICVHSDTPGADAIARSVRMAIEACGVDLAPFATADS